MNIYLIRHGKDDGGYRGGWSDKPIIQEGENQVKKLACYLKGQQSKLNIEKIISSDLKRAKQSAKIINEKLNLPIEYTKRLREMNNGKLAGMPNSDAEEKYPGLYYNTLELNERYPGGESPLEFYNRIVSDFEDIINENKKYNNIILVTHSGVIDIIYRYIKNMEWSNKIKAIKVSNAGIYSLVINNKERYFELENFVNY